MSGESSGKERPRQDYYNTKELQDRGWTEEQIEKILGRADVYGVNPYHKEGPRLCFYLKDRVHRMEQLRASAKNGAEYVLSRDQMLSLLDDTIDTFLHYQYRHGYEEPQARILAIRDIIDKLHQ